MSEQSRLSIEEKKARIKQLLAEKQAQKVQGLQLIKLEPQAHAQAGFPLSASQLGLWMIEQIETGTNAYQMSEAYYIQGNIDFSKLQKSFSKVCERHDVLRTVFKPVDGKAQAQVQLSSDFELQHTVLNEQTVLADYLRKQSEHAFQLDADRLLRAEYIVLPDDSAVLFFGMHHLISDAWSVDLLLNEIAEAYQQLQTSDDVALPPLPIQYQDFSIWQNNWLAQGHRDRLLSFWKEQLSGLPTLHRLPLDFARPAEKSFNGARVITTLPHTLVQSFNELLQANGATLFMGLQSVMSALISRYSGETDVVLGTTYANREQSQTQALIGYFINTLVLRTDLSGEPTFSELLKRCREVSLNAFSHHQLPFDALVEALNPERSLSYNPIFQIMLSYSGSGEQSLTLGEASLVPVQMGDPSAQFDLSLDVSEQSDGLQLTWEYATDLFEASTIERMAQHFEALLQTLVADPEVQLSRIPLLSKPELTQQLQQYSGASRVYPGAVTVHERFAAIAEQMPEAIAAVHNGERLSYGALKARVNQVAHRLVARGVGPNTLVALHCPRGLDFLVGVLGTLSAGGAYVPLDPNNPADRLSYMVEHAQASVVLTHTSLAGQLDYPQDSIALALDDASLWADQPVEHPDVVVGGDDLAYMIFTSGSTGRPKGALVHHAGALNHIDAEFELLDASDAQGLQPLTFLQSAASSSDVSVWQFLAPVVSGGTTVILDDQSDVPNLVRTLQQERVQLIQTAPVVLQVLVDYLEQQAEQGGEFALPDLRWLMTIAEACPVPLINRWFALNPEIPIMNGFGPSEASDDITYHILREPLSADTLSVPIGRPIANLTMYVVDEQLQLQPHGVVGELCVSGVGVGPGYWQDEARTNAVFVANPYAGQPGVHGERLYRTGDLGRWLPDGTLEFLGRKDNQVKIRGFRVELGEVEAALAKVDGTADVAVLVQPGPTGDARLAAYVVPSDGVTLTAEQIRTALQAHLPEYMLPSSVTFLERMPLNAADKIDRAKLPAPDWSQSQVAYRAPEGELEQTLAEIWRDVLGVEQVGRDDHFFLLGGHSLLIMRVLEQARQAGYQIAARTVFDAPTLSEQATKLTPLTQDAQWQAPANRIPESCEQITPEMLPLISLAQTEIDQIATQIPGGMTNIQDIYPLAPLQKGLLFHHIVQADNDTYVTPIIFDVDDKTCLDQLLFALQAVITRHDILRTSFIWEGVSEPIQVVQRKVHLPVTQHSVSKDQTIETLTQALTQPESLMLDLTKSPLMLVEILSDAATDQHRVILKEHHLVSDHVSVEIELEEIRALMLNSDSPLEPAIQYREFVAHTQRQSQLFDSNEYFTRLLSDVDEPTAPFGLLDVYGSGQEIESAASVVSKALTEKIHRLCSRLNVGPASLFHLVWGWVIARSANRDDVVFGSVMSGRLQGLASADRMLGLFINMLPVRASLLENDARSLVQSMQQQLVELLSYEHVALSDAQQCSGLTGGSPLFSAILNYRHDASALNQDDIELPGVSIVGADELTNYPLELSVDVMADGFALEVFVDRSIGAQRVLGYVEQALEQLVEALEQDASTPVLSLPLLSDAEQDQQLQQYSGASRIYPGAVTVHERFAAIAEQMPEAIAAVHNGERLSYGALKARVNQVAHRLVARGVGPNTLVALHCPRGLDFLVGVLGTLSAGGAYVPLDPNNPADRLSYMVEHAQASVVLTHTSLAGQLDYPQDSIALALDDASLWADQPVEHPDVVVGGDDLAYMIFTSGSTGRPKGALVHHAGALNHIDAEFELLDASDAQGLQPLTFLQSAASSSDVSVWQFLAPVVSGGTTVILDDQSDVPNLVRTLQQERVQLIQTAPVVLQVLVDYLEQQAEQGGEFALPDLRWLMTIAEACPVPLINRWFALNPEIPIMNGFGPSEASDDITYHILREPLSADTLSVPIGRPIANLTMYVVDEQLQLQPHGVVGELCVSGVGVGPGYWQDEARTNAVFVANPYAGQPGVHGERLYRTGDLGRWLPDGTLEFLGRKDNQVKIRGFRVELGEVEAALAKVDGTADVAVLVQPGPTGDARLAAYVVPSDGVTLTAEQIRTALQAHLPEYMLPSSVTFLERMPLNAADKIDRAKLPAPDWSQSQVAYRAPEGELEQTLAEIWRDVLGVEQVGRDDHFFLLGGHSLLIMRVLEQARQAGYQIAARTVFDAPTLSEQATKLMPLSSEAQWQAPANRIPESCAQITPEMLPLISLTQTEIDQIATQIPGGMTNIQDIYPLAPLQKGLLFHHIMSEQSHDAYIPAMTVEFDSRARLDAFVSALKQVIDRHDILRTAFVWQEIAEPVQVVLREADLIVEEFSATSDHELQTMIAERMRPKTVMDLSTAPLMHLAIANRPGSNNWVMVFKEHHLISDHVSVEIELNEILALMAAGSSDQPVLEAPVQFREFVAHTQAQSQQDAAEQFFTSNLSNITEPTLAFGLEDVYEGGSEVSRTEVGLDQQLASDIYKVADQFQVTPAALFHAVWGIVLARCSSTDQVVFGTVMSGRLQGVVGSDQMLGLFINMLPVPVNVAESSLEILVKQTHRYLVDLVNFEQSSLADAQRCSGVSAQTPLFNAILNYRHDTEGEGGESEDWHGIKLTQAEELTNYPFELSVDVLGDGFSLEVFADERVGADRMARYVISTMRALVDGLSKELTETASNINVLDDDELNNALVEWNQTQQRELLSQTWAEYYIRQAQTTPDAIAVVAAQGELTYSQLLQKSTQRAQQLLANGLQPGNLVAVLDHRDLDLMVTVVALMRAGLVYVPLDPTHPSQRWIDVIQEAKPALCVVGENINFAFDDASCRTVRYADLTDSVKDQSTFELPAPALTDLAYVIYTSGSTGRPKGVMIEHRGMINNMLSKVEPLGLSEDDVIAQTASQCFDISVWQFLTAPLLGAKVCILDNDTARDPSALLTALTEQGVTVWEPVPSVMQAALLTSQPLPSLRWVLPTGEALSKDLVQRWFETYPNIPLMNAYGPAECSDDVAFEPIHGPVERVLIGRPVANARLHVVDAHRQLVPVGVVGELAISGPVVGRGYLNRDDLTAEVFIDNPFVQDDLDQRLYLTGDLVRRLDDGRLEYVGRKDFQVKIRGFRIELGEIESSLTEHDDVREALVVAHNNAQGEASLIAYAISHTEQSNLKDYLKERLPAYMVPSLIITLDAFPVSANGKIDRHKLPAPDFSVLAQHDYEAPKNKTEQLLAEIWSDLLCIEKVGRQDNFFELGGHSLTAVQLASQIQKALGKTVSLRTIFETTSLYELAILVNKNDVQLDTIPKAPRNQIIPLSFAQQRLWVLDQLDDNASQAYHIQSSIDLDGALDIEKFNLAFEQLIHRHEILRTQFEVVDGIPRQIINESSTFKLQVIDQIDMAQAGADVYLDIENGPLFHASLFRLAPTLHRLNLTMHHIISDERSEQVFIDELLTIYAALYQNVEIQLPELSLQYADYALWQRDFLSGEVLEEHKGYWLEQLNNLPVLHKLPTDNPRPLEQSYKGAAFVQAIDSDTAVSLNTIAKKHQATLFMVLQSAFSALLARYSGETDIVFGSPIANREQPGIESTIGFFVNTLVMRVDLSGNPTWVDVIAQCRQTSLDAYAHQQMPFDVLVDELNPERSLSYNPIFQVMMSLEIDTADDTESDLSSLGLTARNVANEECTAQFDLSLDVSEQSDGLQFTWEYATDLFEASTIERMAQHFEALLQTLVADPEVQLSRIPLLSKPELTQQLQQYSGASRVYPGAVTVHERFAAIAEQMPEAIAAVHNGERLSYGALKARVNQVAHRLVARGVGPNTLVALHCPRGLDFLVGVLGTLSAGGAYVPLDPNNPADRLSYMVEHAQASVVLTHTSLAGQLDYPQDSIALALDDASLWADQPVEHPDVVVGGDDLAYMIFTSGSTGRPKGALVHHAGALNHIDAEFELLDASDAQGLQPLTFLQSAASSSDVSVWQFLAPVVSGGTTVILDDQSDVPNLVRTLQQERVQLIQTAPVVLQVLVDYLEQQAEQGGEFALPDLRWLMTIAEACPVPLINRWFALNPEIPIMNGFGPSEASDDITYHILREPLSADTLSVPIGRPIANLTMYVVDEQLQLQPHGVVGELCVSGVGVGPGYWQDEARTNAVFVANPYAGQPGVHGERLYRTGDLGRWLPDGTLEFLGRKDNQVKIRGFRVELGEVEAALAKVDGTADVAVLVQPGPTGDARLAAYVVPSDGVTLTAEQIRTALQAHLPEYMLPSSVTFLERMPLNAADKIDRAKLPAPDWSQSQVAYRAPEGELEQTLAEIWRDVLGVEQVGRDDHFFLLGGHSLLAVQLVARVQQQLQRALALRDVFDRPELQRMAALLAEGDHTEVVAITPVGRTQPIPLSWSQQRLWFIDQLDAQASEAYHMANALQLSGELNIAALQQALTTIVDRHEVLRTSYQAPTGEPVQVINPHAQFPLTISDLSTLTATEQTARLDQLTAECAQAPFDLAQGPVIRGQLVRLSEREHRLLITTHHIASDGWSENLFIDELSALYDAFAQGDANPLAPLPIQYADYAAWQRTALSAERLSEQLAYWQQHLDGAPSLLELPLDHARPAEQSFAGDTVDFQLPTELSDGLRSLAQAHGLTLNMVLYSAWAVLLCRLSGQNDVVIGSPVANRPHAALEPLLGFFVNTVALRTELRDDPSVAALLQRVKATWLDGVAHQDVPFEQLVDAVQPNRSLSHSPIFQVMFAMDNTGREDQALELDGLQIQPAQQHEQTTVCDLTLSVEDDEEGIGASLEFATALFSRATIERWAGYYTNLLTAWLVDTDQAISQSPILPAVEQQRVLQDFNPHRHDPSIDTPLVRLFEQQVQAAPTAIAVIDGEQRVSYTELNQRAEQLAQSLAEQHADRVEPGATVALLMPRGQAQIIGQLALLKLAVTAVPIDPAFPDERRAYLLADSQAGLILTTVPEQAEQVEQTQKANTENTETGTIPVIDVTTLAFTDEAVVSPLNRDVQAYIDSVPMTLMYTSGSTGQPKGVMAPQRGATRIARDNGYAAITSDDTLVHCSNPAFDGATFEVWGALLNGAKTVIVPHDTLLNVDAFIDLLTQHQVSFFFLTVGLFNQYADAFIAQRTLVNMKAVFVGGEALDPGIMQRVREQAGPQQLCNIYGPTETTTFATYHPIERAYTRSIPIGRPIGQTTVYLLDALQQPVPEGVCGELYIGGSGVAMGYLNRPELTAERFIADPFSDTPNARLYRTGDLGRWVEDGAIEFLGRNDDQVKLRGFRIELGEIEARLKQQPAIHEVAVLVLEASPGDKRLVAYVSPQNGQLDSLNPQDIQHELRRTLPEYMVPQAIVSLEQFPLNSSGKIDRKRLPAPDASAFQQRDYVAPSNETERQLAELWQQLLPVEQVGRHDHFFELGGHSLLAVQLVSRVHSDLGDTLVLRDVFDAPELHRLAERLTNQTQTETALDTIEPADRSGPIPLSWSQQRLWFIAQLDAQASEAYHIPGALEWHGELNRTALQQALDRILARHEVLRTVFAEQNGQPVQVIQPAQPFALRTVDLRHSVDLDHDLQAQAEAEESRAFDLSQGPLIRATLVQTAEQHHVLLVTLHHIISDGWSLGVFSSELNALYIAFASGHADPLAPLAIQYADYAVWQRQTLAGERLQSQLTYWQQQLADIPQVHNLPLDFPRPVEQSYQGGSHESRLSPTLSDGLKTLARAHDATLFMTLQAAFAGLLGRYSGETDIVMGTTIANREQAGVEGLMGLFVNTLVLRSDLSEVQNFAGLLSQSKERLLGAYAHQQVPFDALVEVLQPERSLSYNPVFQVMFSSENLLEDNPSSIESKAEWQAPELSSSAKSTQFDLTLDIGEEQGRLVLSWEYATDLFEASTIERMAQHFEALLQTLVADPEVQLSRIPLLSKPELTQQLQQYSGASRVYPGAVTVHERFAAIAEQMPEAIAAVHNGERLSYGALKARVNQVAHRLVARGVGPNTLVALHCPRGLDFLVGVLGTLSAGGAYVPLDPNNPADRLSYMVEHAQASVVLTHTSLAGQLDYPQDSIALALDDASLWADQPVEHPDVVVGGDDLAYMIFTSGSTGRPKGALVHHAGALNHIDAEFELLDASDAQGLQPLTFLQSAASSSDVSVWQFLAPVVSGGTTVILDDQSDVPNLVRTLQQERVQLIQTAPVVLQVLVDYLEQQAEQGGEFALPDLRWLMTIAEACPVPLINRWFALNPEIPIMNGFGPSEASDDITYHILREPLSADTLSVPIGRPIANLTMYVVDEQLQLQPHGVVGELCVSGVGVGPGYWQDEARTNAVFVANPYAGQPGVHGERLYRTGDLGRWLPDGTLEFLGRKDNQVKIRGFRVELGEVEAALAKVDGTADVAVLVQPGPTGDARLAAYVVPSDGVTLTAEQIRTALQAHLPEYMLPSSVTFLERMPLNAADKIDRAKLPAPDWSQSQVAYRAPEGELEQTLAEIWRDVLGVEQVGRDDHFFLLGGHSLLAVQLVARVQQQLQRALALRDVFDRPELQRMAALLAEGDHTEVVAITPVGRTQPIPLSWSQQRLWFIDQLDAQASEAYHMANALQLSGELNIAALQQALTTIVDRHEVLRTSYQAPTGEPVQVINPHAQFPLTISDLSTLTATEQTARLDQLTAECAQAPFDLAQGPVIRGQLVRLSEREHRLLITTHHIASDGWSENLFIDELSALYDAFAQGDANPLAPLPIQYADYAAWQRTALSAERLSEQLAYWQQHLDGAPSLLELPLDHARPAEQSFAGDTVDFQLPTELSDGLRSLAQAHGLTLNMVLYSAWAVLLCRLSGQNDVVIGSPVANRPHAALEPLLGFFVNTVALRTELRDDPSVAALLQRVKATWLDGVAHQDVPFEQLVDAVQPNRSLSHSPIFQVMFAMDNTDEASSDRNMNQAITDGLSITAAESAITTAQCDLVLTIEQDEEVIEGTLIYASALFNDVTVQRFVRYYQQILQAFVEQPQINVGRLDYLSKADKNLLLNDFNQTQQSYPRDALIHQLVEAHAQKVPDALAVSSSGRQYTYQQLNAKANQIARQLIDNHVQPGDFVAFCTQRNADMMVIVLAILKAGGVYLPIDASYPIERIEYMLTDASPRQVIVDQTTEELISSTHSTMSFVDLSINCQHQSTDNLDDINQTLTPDDCAYVIYTSGSTGLPKGTLLHHRGLCNLVTAQRELFKVDGSSRILQFAAVGFDACTWEWVMALGNGASLHLFEKDMILPGEPLAKQLCKTNITHVTLPPTALGAMSDPDQFIDLKTIIVAGEACPPSLAEAWSSGRRFVNAYGPSETTVCATVCEYTPKAVLNIGQPIANTEIFIVDSNDQPQAVGVVGEILIGGVGVGVGYHNKPELTAEKFIANPFNTASKRLYRTGDLGCWEADGTIRYLGRNDHQVKLRGFRIELGEIEAQLGADGRLIDVLVLALTDPSGEPRLVAYASTGAVNARWLSEVHQLELVMDLKASLRETLPDYMVPHLFVISETLPITPNGKIDRRALPAPDFSQVLRRVYVAPVGEVELFLAETWQRLLNIYSAGRYDNFFDLGGHSLLSTQLAALITKQYDIEIPIRTLFEMDSLAELASYIEVLRPSDVLDEDEERETFEI